MVVQAKGLQPSQLLSDGAASRLVALGSLVDSLSFLADDIQQAITRWSAGDADSSTPVSQSPTRGLQSQRSFKNRDSDGLMRGLSHLLDQYEQLTACHAR